MSDEFIATFEKNSKEEVRVSIGEFHGKKLINIRVYFRDTDGEYKPSNKGIALSVDLFPQLADAVLRVGEALQNQGLIRSA